MDWYQASLGGTDMQSFTLKQIAAYTQAGVPSVSEEANKAKRRLLSVDAIVF